MYKGSEAKIAYVFIAFNCTLTFDSPVALCKAFSLWNMFPLNDFNVVCCALATFSAAIGYQYSKRRNEPRSVTRSGSPSRRRAFRSFSVSSTASESTLVEGETDCPSPKFDSLENASDVTEPGTLKRKNREGDEDDPNSNAELNVSADPHQCDQISPPRKRSRSTPPAEESIIPTEVNVEERTSSYPPPIDVPALGENTISSGELASDSSSKEDDTHPNSGEDLPDTTAVDIESEKDKQPQAALELGQIPATTTVPPASPLATAASTPSVPALLQSSYRIPGYKPSSAFTAFASSSSGFGSFTPSKQRPVWSTPTFASPNDVESESSRQDVDALVAHRISRTPETNLTGEEDEEVLSEVKGAKLYIKRGDKDFTDGMFGNVKLLSHPETKARRLVFRREPVWKVSMSVRLGPAVLCSLDENQGILRVTLKEAISQETAPPASAQPSSQQVVVYAMRRGKLSKDDFVAFAKSVTVVNTSSIDKPAAPSTEMA
ncbi:hypothetical protein K474DRAFT_1665323 [Panus rudis PR-1116 ss-1]|nr:hypothetical protein K474DRAFT_1665323 [Panus rudis PR-1116 ss-1]